MVLKKDRIFYFDEIRALAIICVLIIHVSKWFVEVETPQTLFWYFSSYLAAVGNLGVPLFFMISGALLLNRKYELKSFFKRRFSRIFIPFVFWIIVAGLFKILFLDHGYGFSDIINIVFREGYVWFIWTLFGLYLFVPVINPFICEFKTKGCEYFLVIWIITFVFNAFGFTPYRIELAYFSGFLGYLILGWYLSNKEFKLSDKSMMIIAVLLFIISTAVCLYVITYQINIGNFYLTPIPVFQASGIYLFFKYSAQIAEKDNSNSLTKRVYYAIKDSKIGQCILSISICSYGMYLTHYMFIWAFQILDKTHHIFLRNPFKWIPFILIITILGSWGLIWIFSKIPYLKKVSGA